MIVVAESIFLLERIYNVLLWVILVLVMSRWIKLRNNSYKYMISCVYGSAFVNNCNLIFLDQFGNQLLVCSLQSHHVLCMGNLNIDFLNNSVMYSPRLTSILQLFNIVQVIQELARITERSATLLDVIVVSDT